VLATALSHFLELGAELELLGSRCNVDLTEDHVDALWTQRVRPQTHWNLMFLLRLPASLLMVWARSSV
jgi:hypothetical protein